MRISGRFCWVEFAEPRAAQAALECAPHARPPPASPRASPQRPLTLPSLSRLDGSTTGGHHLRVSQSKSAIHSNGLRRGGGAPPQDAAAAYGHAAAAYGAPPAAQAYPGYPPAAYGAAYGAAQAYPGYAAPYGAETGSFHTAPPR